MLLAGESEHDSQSELAPLSIYTFMVWYSEYNTVPSTRVTSRGCRITGDTGDAVVLHLRIVGCYNLMYAQGLM